MHYSPTPTRRQDFSNHSQPHHPLAVEPPDLPGLQVREHQNPACLHLLQSVERSQAGCNVAGLSLRDTSPGGAGRLHNFKHSRQSRLASQTPPNRRKPSTASPSVPTAAEKGLVKKNSRGSTLQAGKHTLTHPHGNRLSNSPADPHQTRRPQSPTDKSRN